MKYLGEEKQIEVVSERQIEYIRCDKCGKKIIPCKYKEDKNQYINIYTHYNDGGIDTHEYYDYCKECAKKVIAEYIDNMHGTEELELTNEYLCTRETYRGSMSGSEEYVLAAYDNNK